MVTTHCIHNHWSSGHYKKLRTAFSWYNGTSLCWNHAESRWANRKPTRKWSTAVFSKYLCSVNIQRTAHVIRGNCFTFNTQTWTTFPDCESFFCHGGFQVFTRVNASDVKNQSFEVNRAVMIGGFEVYELGGGQQADCDWRAELISWLQFPYSDVLI